MLEIACFGKSDIGLKRSNNEDAFVVKPELGLCIVADGMGGAAAGEIASRIFVETTLEVFSRAHAGAEEEIRGLIQNAFSRANEQILNHVEDNPHHSGMGCTAELMGFHDKGFILGHVGDSRTYRFRNRHMKQLTQDHTLIQTQMDEGIITQAEARDHPFRSVILRAVGIQEKVELDLVEEETLSGDVCLLCSDGLTDMVDDAAILEILCSAIGLSQKVEELIELAKSSGGNDNITVVLSEVA